MVGGRPARDVDLAELSEPAAAGRCCASMCSMPDLRSTLETNLRGFSRLSSIETLAPAAVAVVVMDGRGRPRIPIFQRPSDMSRHAGQMALPGGRVQDGESAEGCAIRELHEELGLDVRPQDVIGLLDDFDTRSGFTITPVVIWADVQTDALHPSKFEVARLFEIGVADLRAAASRAKPGQAFSLRFKQASGGSHPGRPWTLEVFAPTAAILYQFSEVALDGRAARVTEFYQPPFTHR